MVPVFHRTGRVEMKIDAEICRVCGMAKSKHIPTNPCSYRCTVDLDNDGRVEHFVITDDVPDDCPMRLEHIVKAQTPC